MANAETEDLIDAIGELDIDLINQQKVYNGFE